eukprot:6401786-Alexandrium_andersonii.AAC.1
MVQRANEAALLVSESFVRGQNACIGDIVRQLLSSPASPGKIFVMHRSWDDATLRMYIPDAMLKRAEEPTQTSRIH